VQCPWEAVVAEVREDLRELMLRISGDPNAPSDTEQWRLFVPGGDSAHLVFAGGSLQEE
jgi:hypothetical protein